MSSTHSRSANIGSSRHFCLEGQFLGFVPGKKSPFKYLQVMTTDGIVPVKLRKSLQVMLFRYLVAGDWVRVVGRQKWDNEQEAMRFKADEVLRIAAPAITDDATQALMPSVEPAHPNQTKQDSLVAQLDQPRQSQKTKPPKILICQKSSCCKRGGRAIADRVERSLHDLGLSDQVTVKHTGCMDRCKAGPNIVFMPDKAKYSRVNPNMIPELVQQHCRVPQPG